MSTHCTRPIAPPGDIHCDRTDDVTLYRVIGDAGNGRFLAYVGISSSWPRRMLQHAATKAWWRDLVVAVEIEHWCCRPHAEAAEIRAIKTERVWFNIAHNPDPVTDIY